MKTAIQIDITFEQILELVKKLPTKQKIKLTEELEKEGVKTKLSKLLDKFKTDELSIESINDEVEAVRQKLYGKQKH
ncbi:type II toxin-antitoxin system VapB15 family antitoxin [Galbibacter pacificus]|uniref:Uncharacterized protein n=1 Tax=Galbibacter pacificus TaxID=2996052 RepID=A0ABT6FWF0_9FLAO|nr:hypothetical protein [Galbibacter pacificus]MDG3583970.1 hypothetical protein [Galbibacter pacificus]MDG3587593.1 hypothetical protein [Galbibacter pacificus]